MSLGNQLDGLQSELGTLGKRVPNDRFEVTADLVVHSRCATSPSAPTMRRSPSARTTLMLVKYGYMRRWPGSRCSTSVRSDMIAIPWVTPPTPPPALRPII